MPYTSCASLIRLHSAVREELRAFHEKRNSIDVRATLVCAKTPGDISSFEAVFLNCGNTFITFQPVGTLPSIYRCTLRSQSPSRLACLNYMEETPNPWFTVCLLHGQHFLVHMSLSSLFSYIVRIHRAGSSSLPSDGDRYAGSRASTRRRIIFRSAGLLMFRHERSLFPFLSLPLSLLSSYPT